MHVEPEPNNKPSCLIIKAAFILISNFVLQLQFLLPLGGLRVNEGLERFIFLVIKCQSVSFLVVQKYVQFKYYVADVQNV